MADTVLISAKRTRTVRIIHFPFIFIIPPHLRHTVITDVKRWLLDNILHNI
jgi:hypothetical protein